MNRSAWREPSGPATRLLPAGLRASGFRAHHEGWPHLPRISARGEERELPDLDHLLRRLGEEQAPDRLSTLEDKVLDRVRGHSFEQEPLRYRAGAIALALLMGLAGGMLPQGGDRGSARVAPFGEPADLAPSTLLVGRL